MAYDKNNIFAKILRGEIPLKPDEKIYENEYVLSFSKYGTSFSAKASQPLIIENPELGYKITYILYDFVKDADEVQYSGDIFFEEKVSSSKKQSKQTEVSIRINPNIFSETNKKIQTGSKDDKFGVQLEDISK